MNSENPPDPYKETAKLTYDGLLEMRRLSFGAQADYGKWLISSIFVMHGSAIAGLAFKATATGAPPYLKAILWFVVGLVLALAAGFCAWCNFSLAAKQYDKWARPSMVVDRAAWPTELAYAAGIEWTMRLAVLCGMGSVGALVWGALRVLAEWK
ncbi:hypothetical protein [Bradyrhizobium japonicum]|uniref:hypothetical protein n=1 Tax=Bradyrhizobium japonicum TaxID=375 RepID=UPI0027150ADE|nr:hypothetical protein [Bradyrhizobium japonicum]WLB19361.1 hypothetical protein QIH95_46925 [Bradyrhizobium japonicum]